MTYAYAHWDTLSAYLHDGSLCIDNNGVENAIRTLALGRKNYLFSSSHEAARRTGMIYSFGAICRKHEVNPYQWLKHTLENVMSINHKNLRELYPRTSRTNQNCSSSGRYDLVRGHDAVGLKVRSTSKVWPCCCKNSH